VVDAEVFQNLLDGFDPTGVLVHGRHYGPDSVRGYDITLSAPKSVSVLWAVAGPEVQHEITAAHDAAVGAVVDCVDRRATTRITQHGQVHCIDTQGITVAAFRQHTSRAGDPQLHTHAVVIAKVQAPGGSWTALDARPIKCDQRTLSAVYHAALRSEVSRRLGVRWQTPENGIAELATIAPEVLEAFSKRTAQVEGRLEVKLERLESNLGRTATPQERYRLEREAAVDSRPSKSAPMDPRTQHVAWRQELQQLGYSPRELVAESIRKPKPGELTRPVIVAAVDQAIAALEDQQSTWREAELVRELARALPTTLTVPASELVPLVEDVARTVIAHGRFIEYAPPALPGVPVRSDGRPVSESPLERRFTTPAIVAQEARILEIAERRVDAGGIPDHVDDEGLDNAQRTVARTVAGTAPLVLVVGPAGTGKTTALRPAVKAMKARYRQVVGLAPSATAAAVLAAECEIPADTVDKVLHDLRAGHRPFYAGTTVIVDEAGMLATPKLDELTAAAEAHDWRLVLVGDPMQLSAVGRGGMFGLLVDTHGAVKLETVHRFTHPWEAEATIGLRAGNTDVLDAYEHYGRLHDGLPHDIDVAVAAHWWLTRTQGSTALLCSSRETARRLNRRLQALRLNAGELAGLGLRLPSGDVLYVGDTIVTRRNDRTLTTDQGVMVKNRATWAITGFGHGTIRAVGADGTVELPADYVVRSVELGYAETIHAGQGRTVDHATLVIDGPVDAHGVYVGMTRGRHTNHVFVASDDGTPARELLDDALNRSWLERPAHEIERELTRQNLARRLDQLHRETPSRDLGRSIDL
jgi:conjugative relaxase-like TrwC/TraI family protein